MGALAAPEGGERAMRAVSRAAEVAPPAQSKTKICSAEAVVVEKEGPAAG
eukprot:CAMPEP_0113712022 /NCGR_PEP_ID=MMETSP0038_2-20120614/31126_1 /TAXON_ID=2898 /ORGANISM="Cryptomonas paramecium" /LENGTH=49 /DNA_ID=CAMNT_0000638433 /DNA_START=208 /DNA_END=355 /DNA_ORIENTATION=+ /assembly_acc=CAM_ASM_000170